MEVRRAERCEYGGGTIALGVRVLLVVVHVEIFEPPRGNFPANYEAF